MVPGGPDEFRFRTGLIQLAGSSEYKDDNKEEAHENHSLLRRQQYLGL